MDAIVIAGGLVTEKDPLFDIHPHHYKALIEIDGKPMVQWVLDAISAAPSIGKVVLVGLPDTIQLTCRNKSLTRASGGADMLENIQCGMAELVKQDPLRRRVLIIASDIPAITPDMIEWEIRQVEASQHDLYYNVIEQKVMEKCFPTSRRSFYPLKDVEVCGADVNAVDSEFVMNLPPKARQIIDARKNLYRQAAIVGLNTLFLLLFRLLTLQNAERWLAKRLHIDAHALLCPFAEMGMDVDKPYQLEIVKAYLTHRDGE